MDAGLKNVKPWRVSVVFVSRLDRATQVEGKNFRPSFERKGGKTSSSASRLENPLTWKLPGPARAVVEALAAQVVPHDGIQLQGGELIPLETKGIRVIVVSYETRQRSHDGI